MFKETMIYICIKLSESFLWKKLTLTIKQIHPFCVSLNSCDRRYLVAYCQPLSQGQRLIPAYPQHSHWISAYFKHFVYVPTKYDAAIHKKKPRIGLSLPILFMPAFSVEKQYQMTHTARTYISDPLCISI